MLWLKFAWRNLWRNRRRTYIQLAMIAGSMWLAIFYNSLQQGLYKGLANDAVRGGSGHIGIYHADYLDERHLKDMVPADAFVARLDERPDVAAVFPRVHVPGLLRSSRASRPAAGLGIDFVREQGHNPLLDAKNLSAGTFPEGPNGVVIGSKLAADLKVKVGKKVVWMAQDAHGEIASRLFKVSGVLHTRVGAIDGGMVLTSRAAMADVIGQPGAAHEVAVLLKDPAQGAAALPQIQAVLDRAGTTPATDANGSVAAGASGPSATLAYPWQRAMPDLSSLIEIGKFKSRFTVFILFVVVAIGTLNTMLMSVTERTREFGMMRSLGIGKGAIRLMIMAEALVLSLIGGALGLALAFLINLRTSTVGMDMSKVFKDMDIGGLSVGTIVRTAWDWPTVAGLVVGMVLLCLLASLYPARWALKVRPADAMRTY